MKSNPFQAKSTGRVTIEAVLNTVFDGNTPEQIEKSKENLFIKEEKHEIDERILLNKLSVRREPEKKKPLLDSCSIFNFVKGSLEESTKIFIESRIDSFVYYQAPESHRIKKEESEAYNFIFLNWRKGLTGLFAEYRRANTKKTDFSFYVYADKAVYYFHTNKYSGCTSPCCINNTSYALLVRSDEDSLNILFDSNFKRDTEGYYLSGRSVLFVLDSILNTQASTVCSLPFVLSKYPFTNGIITKPEISIKPEKHRNTKTYRIMIKGWIISRDILALNEAIQLEAKQTDNM